MSGTKVSTDHAPKSRVLVVDDDPDLRQLVRLLLQREGCFVLDAPDGPQALDILRTADVDLVVLDLTMPGMSGLDVLAELRADPRLKSLPVLVCTGSADSADAVAALDAGANDLVTKPYQSAVLAARVRAQLRLVDQMKEAREVRSPVAVPIVPGALLGGRYRLVKPIGRGSQGVVWRAEHVHLERAVAIKLLTGGDGATQVRSVTQQEGMRLCRVAHPGCVAVYDFDFTADGTPFLVLELLDGRALDQELRDRGALAPVLGAALFAQAAETLAAAHAAGVVHRDIKPSNLFLQRGARGLRIRILDFGIAEIVTEMPESPGVQGRSGTPAYMAPEAVAGFASGAAVDVYGLGLSLYEALRGSHPFRGNHDDPATMMRAQLEEHPAPLAAVQPGLPRGLTDLVDRMIAKDPAHRPTAAAVADALQRLTPDGEATALGVADVDLDGSQPNMPAIDVDDDTWQYRA